MARSIHSKTASRSASSSWLLALALALGALGPAHAGDDAQKKKARAHFKQGRAYQDAGSYPEAVKEYEAAYALMPEPELLFNIGQAYRLGGDKKKAIEYYRRYLEKEPDGRGADQASAHIAKLGKELEREKKAAEKKPVAVEKKPAAVEKKPVAVASPAPAPSALPSTSTPTAETVDPGVEEGTEGRGLRWGGIATAGVGVAGIGLGFYFMNRVSKLEKQGNAIIDETGTWDMRLVEIERKGKAAERNMIISFVAGGAALLTGGLLYYLGAKDAEAAIAVAPGEGQVMVGWRF